MNMHVYYVMRGMHTHLRVFIGLPTRTYAKVGDLVLTNEEFEAWRNGDVSITFIREETFANEVA